MILPIEFYITLLIIIALYFYYKWQKRVRYYEKYAELPCWSGIPIFGCIFNLRKPLCHTFHLASQKFGPIFKVKLGLREVIVINKLSVMKKTLRQDVYSGRYSPQVDLEIDHYSGLIRSEGALWALHRNFILRVLRDFGFGKSKSVEMIQDEYQYLSEYLRNKNGTAVDFSKVIPQHTANIISKFIFNKRYEMHDTIMKNIIKIMDDFAKSFDIVFFLSIIFPFLNNSTLFNKFVMHFTSRKQTMDVFYDVVKKEVKEHSQKINEKSTSDDFIDRYIEEKQKIDQDSDKTNHFTEWQLLTSIVDLFAAGYETTSTTLGWACLFASQFPNYQEKMYEEIEAQTENTDKVTMTHKKDLPFTQAFMDEVLRLSSAVPLAISHRVMDNTVLDLETENGDTVQYLIPGDSILFYNTYSCHRDPEFWEKPNTFYPYHFMDQNMESYLAREELIPFGLGKRQCLGESLARMEYFIFFTNLIKQFRIEFADGGINEKEYQDILSGNEGLIRFCKYSQFRFVQR